MKNEIISIIIPCYNGEKYIAECLDHLLNQTYTYLQIIVVDDGSKDSSYQILQDYVAKFKEKGMELILAKQENGGAASAINTALKYVTGDYLVWQDIDDYYELDAIENMYNFLTKNQYDFIRGECLFFEETETEKITSHKKSKYPNETNIFDFYIFETDSYNFSGVFMTSTKYFDKCIKDRKIYVSRGGQNWQLILPLAYKGKCGYLNKIVYNYRVLNDSHSHKLNSRKEKLARYSLHKDILLNVIQNIDMPKKEFRKYKHKINMKYFKIKFRFFLSWVKSKIIKKKGV